MANVIDPNDVIEKIDKRSAQWVGLADSENVVYYEFTAPNGVVFVTRPEAFTDQATKDNKKAQFIIQLEGEDF